MSSKPSIGSESSRAVANLNVQELILLATRGLARMFDDERQLFCHRLVRTEGGLIHDGFSQRYTIMTLLGLRELERNGGITPFDTQALYGSFARDTSWIRGAGDVGLMVWLTATFAPDQLRGFFSGVNLEASLDRYADARQGRTTELAWFLAGLAHAASTSPKIAAELMDVAVEAYHRMEQNQGEYGFFGHMAEAKSPSGVFRGRIGSFADQIYPIYAMSKFAVAFSIEEPLGSALECASAICGSQGTFGQWWWLYDSRSGRISSRYPVYSVHQHGMAPMGLFALEEATGRSFKENIERGLRWVYGSNELGVDMRDDTQSLIWRCILPLNRRTKYWDCALSLIRPPKKDAPTGPLRVLTEDRPYELGWLLYAFAKYNALES